jgi:hypothetical protein
MAATTARTEVRAPLAVMQLLVTRMVPSLWLA